MLTLSYSIMNKRNVDGKIYACDIRKLFKVEMGAFPQLDSLQEKMTKMDREELARFIWKVQVPDRIALFFKKLIKIRVKVYFDV